MSREPANKAVGYGSPPEHSRFKKGQSGNPSGRRKRAGTEGEQDDIKFVLSQPVSTILGGKKVKITARRGLWQKLLSMGFEGNLRAIEFLLKIDSLNDNGPAKAETELCGAEIEALIANYAKRKGWKSGDGDD